MGHTLSRKGNAMLKTLDRIGFVLVMLSLALMMALPVAILMAVLG